MLVVRYIPPDRIGFEEVRLETGDVLKVGRDSAQCEIVLYEADLTISRAHIFLEERDDGVRVFNNNRSEAVELAASGHSGMDLGPKEGHTLPGSGWVKIPGGHTIEFELSRVGKNDLIGSTSDTTTTRTNDPFDAWEQLYDGYRKTLTALVAAWFIDDFAEIPYRTPASNKQIARLLGVSLSAANKKLDRSKDRLERLLAQEFVGEPGRHKVAEWVISNKFVTKGEVEELPGIDRLVRRC